MEASSLRGALLALAVVVSLGASHRTPNFVVTAPTAEIAQQVGKQAEQFRQELSVEWLGKPMPNWARPCPVTVEIGSHLGAGGATSFMFDQGEVFGWQMNIQGPLDRVLDSVLPHEVTHTIFASHFRQPLPRWADEGACTTVEHPSERQKQQKLLVQFLQTGRGISFSQMFAMREYPRDILPLYAQGHSLASFLLAQGGKRKYIDFVGQGLKTNDWIATTRSFYGYSNLAQLQATWLDWVRQGSPAMSEQPKATLLVDNSKPTSGVIYRGQSADPPANVSAARDVVPAGRLIPIERTPVTPNGWYAAATTAPAPSTVTKSLVPTVPTAPAERRQILLEWSRDNSPVAAATPSPSVPGGRKSVYDARVPTDGVLRR